MVKENESGSRKASVRYRGCRCMFSFFVKGGVRTKIGKELLAKRHAWIGSFRGKGIVDVEKKQSKRKQNIFQRSETIAVMCRSRAKETARRLSADRAPAGRVCRGSVSCCLWLGCGLGTAAKHNTACEDGGLASIVGSHLSLGCVYKDTGLA